MPTEKANALRGITGGGGWSSGGRSAGGASGSGEGSSGSKGSGPHFATIDEADWDDPDDESKTGRTVVIDMANIGLEDEMAPLTLPPDDTRATGEEEQLIAKDNEAAELPAASPAPPLASKDEDLRRQIANTLPKVKDEPQDDADIRSALSRTATPGASSTSGDSVMAVDEEKKGMKRPVDIKPVKKQPNVVKKAEVATGFFPEDVCVTYHCIAVY